MKKNRLILGVIDGLNFYMHDKKISQEKLAKILGKGKSYISKALAGHQNFEINTIAEFEKKLGIVLLREPKWRGTIDLYIHVGAQIHDSNRNKNYIFTDGEWLQFGGDGERSTLPKETFRLLRGPGRKDIVQNDGYFLIGHTLSEMWCFL